MCPQSIQTAVCYLKEMLKTINLILRGSITELLEYEKTFCEFLIFFGMALRVMYIENIAYCE